MESSNKEKKTCTTCRFEPKWNEVPAVTKDFTVGICSLLRPFSDVENIFCYKANETDNIFVGNPLFSSRMIELKDCLHYQKR